MAIDYVLAWGKVCLLLPVRYWSPSGKEHIGSRSVRISSGWTSKRTVPDRSLAPSLHEQHIFHGARTIIRESDTAGVEIFNKGFK